MRGRTRIASALAAALAATMLVGPAGADSEDHIWKVDVWGHPMEPYAQIPEELQTGSPGTWAQLQGALPRRCETVGALLDTGGGGVTVDQLAYELSDKNYENPAKAWAANPPTRNAEKDQMTTIPNGPTATAACSTPNSGTAAATWGRYLSEGFSFESSSSDTSNELVEDEQLFITETINKVHGVKVGPLSVGFVLSWLKVEYRPSVEPIVSYRIELGGISDGQQHSGAGATGLVLAGQGIPGSDVSKQFNAQVKGGESSFKTLGKYGLRVMGPRVGYSRSHRYVIEISAFDGLLGLAARENQAGQGAGWRVAVSRSAGRYEVIGTPAPAEGYEYIDDPTFGFY
jgi:hypothetical protein